MSFLQIQNFCLSFPHKTCFEDFSAHIFPGDRIAIIGRNGSGKSSLLKMIAERASPIRTAYIPQMIQDFDSCSGGEKFHKALSAALGENPDLLLLDEPTNHLDRDNRCGLLRKLHSFQGVPILVTHDKEILQHCVDILWHIDKEKITIFQGKYDAYMREQKVKRHALQTQIDALKRQEKGLHESLMKEQERVKKSVASGKKKVAKRKWLPEVGALKAMKAEVAQGAQRTKRNQKKEKLVEQLSHMRLPEEIIPKFNVEAQKSAQGTLVSLRNGCVAYGATIILSDIFLSVGATTRMAITGRNGSEKSTLIKGIFMDPTVTRTGEWVVPQRKDMGFLDQHYKTLDLKKSALEIIAEAAPCWNHADVRRHLNNFLFRKNEEVQERIENLSGGERARLSLAQIAAHPPKLLILDEITNNLDLETRDHVIQILRDYPGAMLVVSHDEDFLKEIKMDEYYET
ncbi:erythromycin ABC transporter ATP-binding protein [Alphaproteobacteria bacterium]|nr:erythromycin ABC transporter ATP-binding protein [Alphaproteobacteria bacterium]GHS95733.1 erythromycin ABC transporter ATP-binding protein [Alphaproteobacteria bacterium]